MSSHSEITIGASDTRNEGPSYMDELAHTIACYEATQRHPHNADTFAEHLVNIDKFRRGMRVIQLLQGSAFDSVHFMLRDMKLRFAEACMANASLDQKHDAMVDLKLVAQAIEDGFR